MLLIESGEKGGAGRDITGYTRLGAPRNIDHTVGALTGGSRFQEVVDEQAQCTREKQQTGVRPEISPVQKCGSPSSSGCKGDAGLWYRVDSSPSGDEGGRGASFWPFVAVVGLRRRSLADRVRRRGAGVDNKHYQVRTVDVYGE